MDVFEVVVALLLGGAVLAATARRIGAPYPALVALAGAALALIPGVPELVLDPELALALFVAPVLVDAAFDSSPRDLRVHWRAVTGLALGAVALTIALVAVVVHALLPDMPWAVAIALGAIVAPPDAAAATTVLKQLRPPHRLLVILEGESLFNDASALLVYRLAVAAAVSGAVSGWTIAPTLLWVTVGSVVLGLVLARPSLYLTSRIRDVSTAIVFQFCGTFGVWMLAERLHLSGIITLVVYAMAAARRAPEIMPARIRIPSWAVWEVAVFILNVLAFILVGFQLKVIGGRLSAADGARYAAVAAAVCATVIVARLAWVTGASALRRRQRQSSGRAVEISPRSAAVVGWCGMRGTVTLAAALALPASTAGGAPFPYRDLILVTAFGVVLGTLVLQGLTLRPLLLRLGIEEDDSVDREVRLARVEALTSAVTALSKMAETETSRLIRRRYELQLRRAQAERAPLEAGGEPDRAAESLVQRGAVGTEADAQRTDAAAVGAAFDAQRRRLLALRADGTIGDTAFHRLEEELDWSELGWAQLFPALRRGGE